MQQLPREEFNVTSVIAQCDLPGRQNAIGDSKQTGAKNCILDGVHRPHGQVDVLNYLQLQRVI